MKLLNRYKYMVILQVIALAVIWFTFPVQLIPSLPKTVGALGALWNGGLVGEIFTSLGLYFTSLFIATITALAISGASAMPVVKGIDIGNIFKPPAEFLAKWRYMSLVGFTSIFQILTPDMYWLKVSILVFGIAPWLITSLNSILETTPIAKINHARTLRFSEWRVAWKVKIWGNRDKAIEAFGQCAAMGLMMLTVAEKLSKDNGGIGVLLAGTEKFHDMSGIFALQVFVLLTIGVIQDIIIKGVRSTFCEYAIKAAGGDK
jgi:ABC-type nitrate/sulfonate/bicarbonate transport system permease component